MPALQHFPESGGLSVKRIPLPAAGAAESVGAVPGDTRVCGGQQYH